MSRRVAWHAGHLRVRDGRGMQDQLARRFPIHAVMAEPFAEHRQPRCSRRSERPVRQMRCLARGKCGSAAFRRLANLLCSGPSAEPSSTLAKMTGTFRAFFELRSSCCPVDHHLGRRHADRAVHLLLQLRQLAGSAGLIHRVAHALDDAIRPLLAARIEASLVRPERLLEIFAGVGIAFVLEFQVARDSKSRASV